MATSRYTAEINLEDVNSSHALAILDVPPGSTVLDIGAADGSVARRLVERGCRVYAIELDPEAARAARSVCERVVEGDVETLDLAAAFEGVEFDAVLLLDVLEHLRDPAATLRRAGERLAPGGHVIASVPNVTHAALRLQLLGGRFRYTDSGLLDRTHLRFFDRPGLEELVRDAGLIVQERLRTTLGLTQTEVEVDPEAFGPETLALAMDDPDAETYQFVYVLTRGEPDQEGTAATASLPELLQRRAHEAERLRAEAEHYTRTLLARISALEQQCEQGEEQRERCTELESELRERMAELESSHEELEHARLDVAIKDEQLLVLRAELGPLRAEYERMEEVLGYARHRLVDRLSSTARRLPLVHRTLKRATERAGYRRS